MELVIKNMELVRLFLFSINRYYICRNYQQYFLQQSKKTEKEHSSERLCLMD